MKKILLACAAFAGVAVMALPAMAQPGGGYGGYGNGGYGYGGHGGGRGGYGGTQSLLSRLDRREEVARRRINSCVDARQMTSGAGFSLLLDLARIEQAEDRAMQDGVLSRFEYADLGGQLEHLQSRIEFACRGLTIRPETFEQDLEPAPRARPDRRERSRDMDDRRGRDSRGDGDDGDDRRGRGER